MQITLDNKDLEVIDKIIQETPFKYAQPLFQFFTQKIAQAQKEAQEAVSKAEAGEEVVKKED